MGSGRRVDQIEVGAGLKSKVTEGGRAQTNRCWLARTVVVVGCCELEGKQAMAKVDLLDRASQEKGVGSDGYLYHFVSGTKAI